MIGILILSHGGLAKELLASAQTISGDLPTFEALALDWNGGVDEAHRQVSEALSRMDHGEGVLILTDMYGSTPSNVALDFQERGRVEVIAGVNLPMVVRLGCMTTKSLELSEVTAWIRDKGRASIRGGQDYLKAKPPVTKCEDES